MNLLRGKSSERGSVVSESESESYGWVRVSEAECICVYKILIKKTMQINTQKINTNKTKFYNSQYLYLN